jgi:Holliday junction resolvase YEN1
MISLFSPVSYQALSEAEAELAAMNVHSIIDAVMTEDSDILIFGAPCIIRRYVAIFLLICCC